MRGEEYPERPSLAVGNSTFVCYDSSFFGPWQQNKTIASTFSWDRRRPD